MIRMCWYCGGFAGLIIIQPDGMLLHEFCEGPAARDYPDRVACYAEQVDAKVAWLDVQGQEQDARPCRA